MLNKEICKRCCDERGDPSGAEFTIAKWRSLDDFSWETEKIVYCRNGSINRYKAKINELPPKWCWYSLEHILKGEN